jgi:hypothetical protein
MSMKSRRSHPLSFRNYIPPFDHPGVDHRSIGRTYSDRRVHRICKHIGYREFGISFRWSVADARLFEPLTNSRLVPNEVFP